MMEYPTLVHRWFEEVWNLKHEEVIDEMMLDNVVVHGLPGGPVEGRENFKGFYRAFVAAFPDLHVTVEDVVAANDKLACRCTVTGTHTGEGLGFAPTNQQVVFTGGGICALQDGKFKEIWNEFDFMTMNIQMGVISFNTEQK